MPEYDETNSGVMFQPHDDQDFIGQGKINIEGNENRIVVIKEKLSKDGKPTLVMYHRAGVLFTNESDNENAPNYSGPLDQHPSLRLAAWRGEKNGRSYLSMKVSEKQQSAEYSNVPEKPNAPSLQDEDEIPF
ncbi:MAG TPA: hypothetical protein DC015_03925 [Aequorivita sp.]|nr:hypothetical protein [Aequorivita sp.]